MPQQLLERLHADGMRMGLERYWTDLETLHGEERFTCQQIARIFSQCAKQGPLDGYRGRGVDVTVPPMGTRLVQLFSGFVCDRVSELTPEEVVTFALALTSSALQTDEYWLFVLAERVREGISEFSAQQLAILAQSYAERSLGDEHFYCVVAAQAASSAGGDFGPAQVARVLFSSARVNIFHEGLRSAAFPLLERHARAPAPDPEALGEGLAAAGILGERRLPLAACCGALAANAAWLRRSVEDAKTAKGIVLAAVLLPRHAGAQALLRQLLLQLGHTLATRRPHGWRGRVEQSRQAHMVQRRAELLGLCAAFGVPQRSAWPLGMLRHMRRTLKQVEEQLRGTAGSERWDRGYEPPPSGLHLQVVSVLRDLSVDHQVEHKQQPFILDLTVAPEQIAGAQRAWGEGALRSRAAESETPELDLGSTDPLAL